MVKREFWLELIQKGWKKASIVWLTGVRRCGKTTLCHEIPDALYLNCDLTDVSHALKKPERFFASVQAPIVILDEVHQLDDPSLALKIAADQFPHIKVLATGSSTLAATKKFRDSLTGRKRSVALTPVLYSESAAFNAIDLNLRLLKGGLPPALLSTNLDLEFYSEWLDSYFARDVQELFQIGKRSGFLRLFELLMRQSGGLAEITSLSKLSGVSRPTLMSYLDVFEITHAITTLRPFHGGGRQEILRQPKIYGFDTGFVCFARGWREVRPDDAGFLWEHLVLDELRSHLGSHTKIHFWRDKQGREVDFVLPLDSENTVAIECKWDETNWDPAALLAFRQLHPKGKNYVVSPGILESYTKEIGSVTVEIVPLMRVVEELRGASQ